MHFCASNLFQFFALGPFRRGNNTIIKLYSYQGFFADHIHGIKTGTIQIMTAIKTAIFYDFGKHDIRIQQMDDMVADKGICFGLLKIGLFLDFSKIDQRGPVHEFRHAWPAWQTWR